MNSARPTTWMERFRDALTTMCGATPPEDMCQEWVQGVSVDGVDRLQDWVLSQGKTPYWAQGIVTIEAAMVWADTPAEGEGHEDLNEPKTQTAESVEHKPGFFRLTPKNGGAAYVSHTSPDSWELRECHIEWVETERARNGDPDCHGSSPT